ncbi:two-component regulator propeller domain-containing protein [Clostridium sp. AL.422]|uniref:ligand-binding sensor domain-containing protein n=1 Tax=Clostridium TaxID=1485 RepID=UPI00293DAB9D|nr:MULTISPECIES: two-component regulator propeller domain-containing protein [unclassified Clostridium]MDV4152060.1 two-component regulator propeller domain-containing protein [Clostridium sp. AL.422]
MKLKLLIILILINILIPIEVSAQTIADTKFENISTDEGLSNEDVTSIFQDSMGYMWIGTKDGLNRYDGERIKIYNCNPESDNTLSSTYITDIEEDNYGNIWIGTDHGLDFLIRDTDTIIRMKDIYDKYNLGNLKITALLKSTYEDNVIWVGTEDGLMKVKTKEKEIEAFYHNLNDANSLTSSSITCLEEGEDNLLWVGTKAGINIIDRNSKVYINENKLNKDKEFISDISKDNSGNIWISTKEGIFTYNIKEDNRYKLFIGNDSGATNYNIEDESINDVYKFEYNEMNFYNNVIFNDSKDNIWFSSSNGAIKYSKSENKFIIFKKNISLKNSISSDVITCFYEDANGTIWIGTDKGINILNDNIIFNYTNHENSNIVSILKNNGHIWIATKFKGIYIYKEESGELVDHLYDEENFSLNDRYIKSLFQIEDKYTVVVTNKELIAFNTKDYSYLEWKIQNSYSSELSYLYSDGKDIWIASTTDFYSYNINTREKKYYSESIKEFGINPGRITYILPDNKDESIIWLGGIDIGLIKYHKENGVIERYLNDNLDKNSLINNYINCMTFDTLGNLWIGTNIGLSKFDLNTKEFTSYTTSEGLTNNFINSILIDDDNNIWISTNKGLNKYDVIKDTIVNYTKMDGLYGYQFNLNSSLKLENGTMMFGSTEGFVYFNINDLVKHKLYKDQVVIGDIVIGHDNATYNGNELILDYNYKNLHINIFLPNYKSLNNITYEYMLERIDSDWIYIDSRSELYFKSLDPGKYTLKVRARDGHGELTKETIMNIRVKNPIWKTPIAYIIYVIILSTIIFIIINKVRLLQKLVNIKTMKLNKQLEENKKLSEELINNEKFKNNYFVNLSHELRTPINVIESTVQLINLLNNNKNITHTKLNQYMNIIHKSCKNLLKVINDIIDSSKIETGKYKINKKNNDIVYIVEETVLNMRNFIEEKGLSLIIDPDMEEKIISFDETEIERCIINLLANAVKFTKRGGEILVYIKEIENYIEITIEDTGIGISKEDQKFIFKKFSQVEGTGVEKGSSSGIGLALVKYIMELHGGYIKLESEINKGSSFTIGIPNIVENNEYSNESRALL